MQARVAVLVAVGGLDDAAPTETGTRTPHVVHEGAEDNHVRCRRERQHDTTEQLIRVSGHPKPA
jgi:hypothetical protein